MIFIFDIFKSSENVSLSRKMNFQIILGYSRNLATWSETLKPIVRPHRDGMMLGKVEKTFVVGRSYSILYILHTGTAAAAASVLDQIWIKIISWHLHTTLKKENTQQKQWMMYDTIA